MCPAASGPLHQSILGKAAGRLQKTMPQGKARKSLAGSGGGMDVAAFGAMKDADLMTAAPAIRMRHRARRNSLPGCAAFLQHSAFGSGLVSRKKSSPAGSALSTLEEIGSLRRPAGIYRSGK